MPKITRQLLAALFAVASVAAFAQQTGRNDAFDQPVTPIGAATVPANAQGARRVSITNSPAGTNDADPAANEEFGRYGNQAQQGTSSQQITYPRQGVNQQQGGGAQQGGLRRAPLLPNEFQKFIADSTGEILPIFGAEFFANAPTTFTPISGAPVPADYPLGAGDELQIRGWGSIDIDYRATIDRNGLISIPTIGSVALAGVKAGDAEAVIRSAVARLYKGVTISVNFGKLRAITVYVVGQAKRPGTYTVSSLSTLVTTLFASGGPNSNGSMRHLQVKRAGKIVAELDLYAFIAKGDKSADIKLQDGDSIYIPSAGGYVALVGMVNKPSIFELRSANDTIGSVLDLAGGLPVVADPRRAYLERIDANRSQPRSVEQFALDSAGQSRTLKNGDVLNITSITPDFSNAVILRGNVDHAVRAPFRPGMRISDLIPNREFLITRSSVKRQNNAIVTSNRLGNGTSYSPNGLNNSPNTGGIAAASGEYGDVRQGDGINRVERSEGENAETIASRIGGLIDEINWDYAVVERINRTDLSVVLIPFNLGKIFSNPAGPDNVQLQPGDTVTVFSQRDVAVPMEKRRVFVRVEGEVNVPGVYQMTAGETLQSLMARAGGPTSNAYLFGTAFYREQVRKEQEVNLQKAADRLESQLRNEQASSIANVRGTADATIVEAKRQADLQNARDAVSRLRSLKPTGRIAFGMNPNERSFARLPQLKLENGDRLVVPARPEFVHVFGSVNSESSLLWRPGARIKDYINMAGASRDSDLDNAFILRVDGSVVSRESGSWFLGGFGGTEVMPGDSIVIPEKLDKETAWTKFTQGTREWAQIFANFGLGAAAVKTLRN